MEFKSEVDRRLYTKSWWFWGIFKSKSTIKDLLGVTPKSMTPAKVGKMDGYIANFDHLSNDEFFAMLGRLTIVEAGYSLKFMYIENQPCYYWLPLHYGSNSRTFFGNR